MTNSYSNLDLAGNSGSSVPGTSISSDGPIPSCPQLETWTFPDGATAVQADWILFNYAGQYSLSLFLAIDGDPTTPTSPLFFSAVPSSFNPDLTQVDILSTDTAAQVAAKFLAALSLFNTVAMVNCTDPVFVDNLDGTVTVTYQTNGPVVFQTVSYISDGSGPGSIDITITQSGELQKSALVDVDGSIPRAQMAVTGNSGNSSLQLTELGLSYNSPSGVAMNVSPAGVISALATISAQEYRSPVGSIVITPFLTDDASPANSRVTLLDNGNSGTSAIDLLVQASGNDSRIGAITNNTNGMVEWRAQSSSSGDPFFFATATAAGGNHYASWNVTPTIAGLAINDAIAVCQAAFQAVNNAGEPEVNASLGGGTGTGVRAIRLVNDKLSLVTGGTTPYDGTEGVALNGAGSIDILGTQVIAAQQAAIADASGGAIIDAEARTALNDLLAKLRIHGIIAA